MANLYSQVMAGQVSLPIIKPTDPAYGGRAFRFRSVINLAAVATSVFGTTQAGIATTDNLLLGIIPAGYVFDFGMITSSVTLSTAVVAIGTNPVHASNGQYRAAATFTAVDTPTLFGLAAAQSAAANTTDTRVYLTAATAAVPSAGTLVIDIYANKP
jgi:hypothetical protein